jgi:hypothetical protein
MMPVMSCFIGLPVKPSSPLKIPELIVQLGGIVLGVFLFGSVALFMAVMNP